VSAAWAELDARLPRAKGTREGDGDPRGRGAPDAAHGKTQAPPDETHGRVFNVGIRGFAAAAPDRILHVDWRPPADGDAELGEMLAALDADPRTHEANREAVARIRGARPRWTAVRPASEVVPAFASEPRLLLHAGPPIEWARMCGPMRGAAVGAALFEGWAESHEEAETMLASGAVRTAPCHSAGAVGPMAGLLSPSMPVLVVEDANFEERGGAHVDAEAAGGTSANRSVAFASLNEGMGRVLRFGANDGAVLERLRWMRDALGPTLAAALAACGEEEAAGIELNPIVSQALQMGDECHNRNAASTALLVQALLPGLLKGSRDAPDAAAAAAAFLAENPHFFLNLSMASAKLSLDAAADVPFSTVATAMARNGVEFGLRVSGTGQEWFCEAAPDVQGLFFPGYTAADANPDLGDSSITETLGLGGAAMAASPAIVRFVGGRAADAVGYTREMHEIYLERNSSFGVPALDFEGCPVGLDVISVVDSGVAPVINTGLAHRRAGVGQIGAGITRAPLGAFHRAVRSLAEKL
jgi:hypothetical protein